MEQISLDKLTRIYEENVKKFGKTAVLRLAKSEADKINKANSDKITLWLEITESLVPRGLLPEKYYPGLYEELHKISEGKDLES